MVELSIFSATLGLSAQWFVASVSCAAGENRLDIIVDFAGGSTFRCPCCGTEGNCYSMENEIWFHNDYFRHPTYLHARVPRMVCGCGCSFSVERPWSRAGSKFALLGEGGGASTRSAPVQAP